MTPRIRVEGTPYERGRQYGMQARAQVQPVDVSLWAMPSRLDLSWLTAPAPAGVVL